MAQYNRSLPLERLRALEADCLELANVDLLGTQLPEKAVYEQRLRQLENSHSGSWFGEHSNTYYKDFQSPPPGKSFDIEWGFIPGMGGSHNPGWKIYSRDHVLKFMVHDIGEQMPQDLTSLANETASNYSILWNQAFDILELISNSIGSVTRYKKLLEDDLSPYQISDYVHYRRNNTPRMTRDSREIARGTIVPVHIQHLAAIEALRVNKTRARDLAALLRNTIQAISLHAPVDVAASESRTIFIGHGRSGLWRELKDFLTDRLGLSYEEFNRVSPAGVGNQERLGEMLDRCGFAFLILTAEDLHSDGTLHARENVIHEAGLFQGRLGWRKAIILLEQTGVEFSNITGLGQIRFPKNDIAARFEEVRKVLEREGIIG